MLGLRSAIREAPGGTSFPMLCQRMLVMKNASKILRIGLAVLTTSVVLSAKAHLEISGSIQINAVADFESPLASVGAWIDIPGHGHCWRPTNVEVGWRPYCNGHWVWTDLGWYWESDEPWGWACYHYGDWAYEDAYGWVWVP